MEIGVTERILTRKKTSKNLWENDTNNLQDGGEL